MRLGDPLLALNQSMVSVALLGRVVSLRPDSMQAIEQPQQFRFFALREQNRSV